ncbi:EIF4E [Mytilus edulis]|uniref:EIF4E n=1 Tax=Mytilus edulis TaxID=6550 RepID=A0A8S3PP41_MYTED|nr:EIF4E [Mytilus edulis]
MHGQRHKKIESWENHSKSLELEEQTLLKITSRIQDKVMNNAGTWIDWQYLLDAAGLLRKRPGPGEHPLQFNYAIWFSRKSQGKSSASYDQNLKLVGTFASVEQFWGIYSHLVRPSDLTGHCDFHLFKEGIRPMWEDSANNKGGKWIVRLKKGLGSRCWENLILAMLGEQFMVGEEICGAVISIRYQVNYN